MLLDTVDIIKIFVWVEDFIRWEHYRKSSRAKENTDIALSKVREAVYEKVSRVEWKSSALLIEQSCHKLEDPGLHGPPEGSQCPMCPDSTPAWERGERGSMCQQVRACKADPEAGWGEVLLQTPQWDRIVLAQPEEWCILSLDSVNTCVLSITQQSWGEYPHSADRTTKAHELCACPELHLFLVQEYVVCLSVISVTLGPVTLWSAAVVIWPQPWETPRARTLRWWKTKQCFLIQALKCPRNTSQGALNQQGMPIPLPELD